LVVDAGKLHFVRIGAAQTEDFLLGVRYIAPGDVQQPLAHLARPEAPPLPMQGQPAKQVENAVGNRGNCQAVFIDNLFAAAHAFEVEFVLGLLDEVLHVAPLLVDRATAFKKPPHLVYKNFSKYYM